MMIRILSQKKLSEEELQFLRNHIQFEIEYFDAFHIVYLPVNPEVRAEEDILIFTSQHAILSCTDYISNDFEIYSCICIDGQTKKLAEKKGFNVLFSAESASELTELILINNIRKRYVHLCSNDRLNTIYNFFINHSQYRFKEVIVYEKIMLYPKVNNQTDILLVFSPSGVMALEKSNLDKNSVLVICIGKATCAKALDLGYKKSIASEKSEVRSMLELLIQSSGFLEDIK